MFSQNLPPAQLPNFRVDILRKIQPSTIMYLKAEINYTTLMYFYKPKIVIARSLKCFTMIPELSHYIRTHQSFYVNPKYIKEVSIWNAQITLTNGEVLPISRRQIAVVQGFMDNQ